MRPEPGALQRARHARSAARWRPTAKPAPATPPRPRSAPALGGTGELHRPGERLGHFGVAGSLDIMCHGVESPFLMSARRGQGAAPTSQYCVHVLVLAFARERHLSSAPPSQQLVHARCRASCCFNLKLPLYLEIAAAVPRHCAARSTSDWNKVPQRYIVHRAAPDTHTPPWRAMGQCCSSSGLSTPPGAATRCGPPRRSATREQSPASPPHAVS